MEKRRIIVGISGASGIPAAVEVLKLLKQQEGSETVSMIPIRLEARLPAGASGMMA